MLFRISANASVYRSQSSGRTVLSWTVSTVAPSGSGRNAWATEVTTQRRAPSLVRAAGTGAVRPSTSTTAGPDGSRTVHTSASARASASWVASSETGVGQGVSETTSEAWLGCPSTVSAAIPAKTTPAEPIGSASEAESTAQSLRDCGSAPANSSSATSASCSPRAATEPRTATGWKTVGTTIRASVPAPVASSSGATVSRPAASSATAGGKGGRSPAVELSGATGSWNCPAPAPSGTPSARPPRYRAGRSVAAASADRRVLPSTTVPSPRTVSRPGPPALSRRPNSAEAAGWPERRKAASESTGWRDARSSSSASASTSSVAPIRSAPAKPFWVMVLSPPRSEA